MTVEGLRSELEIIISSLSSSGFGSIDSEAIEELNKLAAGMDELGLKEGKRLTENLTGTMKAIQEGKSQSGSGDIRLMALDFYVKKLSDGENTEEL